MLIEHELAERDRRRLERHLGEAKLLAGTTLATFVFDAVPMISRAQLSALCAGDAWLAQGANVILFGPPGGGKRRELALEAAIHRLDRFDLLILDGITDVSKDQAESSVLFELISARYERRSQATRTRKARALRDTEERRAGVAARQSTSA